MTTVPARTVASLLTLPALAWSGALRAQEPVLWRPEDRAVLTAFDAIEALARDERRIYGATARGMILYDFVAARWELPSTEEDGYPVGRRPTALAFDAENRAVWLATGDGELFSFQVDLQRWDAWGAAGVGPILRIVPIPSSGSAEGGLYFLASSGWHRVGRFGGIAQPVDPGRLPPEVAAAAASAEERLSRADPTFAALRGTLTLDPQLRRWPITDYVADERPDRYWIATRGGHLLYYDSRFMRAESRPFGLLTAGVQSLAGDGTGGLWFGGDGRGPRRGVTWGALDLQQWQSYEAGVTGAPAGPVFRISGSGTGVWFAAADGVYRLDLETERWQRWTEADGLPSSSVYGVEPARDGGVWVATARGAARVTQSGEVRVAPGLGGPVRAFLVLGDTLWVGGELGVYRLLPDGSVHAVADPEGAPPPAPALDLAVTPGAVWALAPDALWRWDGRGWEGPLREVALGGLGPLVRIRSDGGALWVAGAAGVARRDPETGVWRYFRAGSTLPRGPVTDVLPVGDIVYVATTAGAERVAWTRAR